MAFFLQGETPNINIQWKKNETSAREWRMHGGCRTHAGQTPNLIDNKLFKDYGSPKIGFYYSNHTAELLLWVTIINLVWQLFGVSFQVLISIFMWEKCDIISGITSIFPAYLCTKSCEKFLDFPENVSLQFTQFAFWGLMVSSQFSFKNIFGGKNFLKFIYIF